MKSKGEEEENGEGMGGNEGEEKKKLQVPFLTSANTRWKQPGQLADNVQTQTLQEVVSLEVGQGGMVAHVCILALRSRKISEFRVILDHVVSTSTARK